MPSVNSRAGQFLAAMSKAGARAKAHFQSSAAGRVFSNWRGVRGGQTRLPRENMPGYAPPSRAFFPCCARYKTDSEGEALIDLNDNWLGGVDSSDEDAEELQEIWDSVFDRGRLGRMGA